MNNRIIKRLCAPLIALVLVTLPIGRVAARPAPALASALPALTSGTLNVHWNSATGTAEFLAGSEPESRLAYSPTEAERGDPVAIAFGYLSQNRALFGIRSAAEELRLLRIEPDLQLHYSHVPLDQN
jgi:hypothetical protein